MKRKIHVPLGMVLGMCIVAGAFFVLGTYVGYRQIPSIRKVTGVTHTAPEVATEADFEPFWKTWQIINEKNPDAKNADDQSRVYGAIKGLVGSLDDPYSEFFTPAESKNFEDTINGSFTGIGMEVGMKDKVITVVAPLKGTPAAAAGIRSGDKILKIDDEITADMTLDQAIDLIRGPEGTVVALSLYRESKGEPIEISVTRAVITMPVIEGELREDGIYVISLYNFGMNSAPLFEQELRKFQNTKSDKLIIDLRGNPGGLLDAAIDMASFFLPKGDVIVREDFGHAEKEETYRSKGYGLFQTVPHLALLIDEGSASASEILAGALSEQGVAKLIGMQTYGKGSVQELIPITSDTSLKITVAKWLTPEGVSISKKGLTPDIEVKITDKDIAAKRDPQLERAVQYLKTGK